MPFYLSLKPQETNIKLPEYEYEKTQDAESKANEILYNCPGLHFVAVMFKDEHTPARLISNVIQKGYVKYNWTQYKMFDRFNRVIEFFVLNGEHYIKLKDYTHENVNTTISFRVTRNEKKAILQIAKRKKMTVSQYIQNLIANDKN